MGGLIKLTIDNTKSITFDMLINCIKAYNEKIEKEAKDFEASKNELNI